MAVWFLFLIGPVNMRPKELKKLSKQLINFSFFHKNFFKWFTNVCLKGTRQESQNGIGSYFDLIRKTKYFDTIQY